MGSSNDVHHITRRQFIRMASAGTFVATTAGSMPLFAVNPKSAGQLALLGGRPVRENKQWPSWPPWDSNIEESIMEAGKRGGWSRINSTSKAVEEFERKFARLIGTRYALGTGSGTQALHTALGALGIGAGDEVLMPPYTDKGTMTAIFRTNALPIFVDEELDSYQMDPEDMERKISEHTKAVIPVHIMGQPADMDRIMDVARRHDLYVIEDACQSHATTYHGKRLGTIGDIACYSFQASKTLACGEGGGITCDDETLMNKCYAYHNHGMGRGEVTVIGPKYRMNEFEAAVLLGQLAGFEQRAQRRLENAEYLRKKLEPIPGIRLQKIYGDTRGTYLLFGFLYLKEHFDELPREKFFEAVRAEGVPLGGYIDDELQLRPSVDATIQSATYQALYPRKQLNRFQDIRMDLPVNKKLCTGDVIAMFSHQYLLADRQDMDDIADAVLKVYENRQQLLS